MPDVIDQSSVMAHVVNSPACHAYNGEAFQIMYKYQTYGLLVER